MADGVSPDDDSNFSRTSTTTGYRKRLDDNSDLGRTRTATRQKKCSLISQTAAQREERLAVERLQHIPFFITSSYYTCTLPYTSFSLLIFVRIHTFPLFLLCYYSSIKFMNCGAMRMPSMPSILIALDLTLLCCLLTTNKD